MKKIIFKKYKSIGLEEVRSAKEVLKSGNLSGFVADNSKDFFGGKYVNKFERNLEKFYRVKHAIVVNSWTSGLICMIGSLDIEPGDEIIVTPWTMAATVASILHWNCIPVFVDINEEDFCIDVNKIKNKISKRTKAIFAVDIFGRQSNVSSLKKITKGKNIKILLDTAQSPYCIKNQTIAGTKGDIGGYSLNYHKIINTGEGGVIVTNNHKLAHRMRLLRNHAEITNHYTRTKDLSNMIGFNFRMGEMEAAIGIEQYKKLKKILKKREILLNKLTKKLKNLNGLKLPPISKNYSNNFYVYPLKIDLNIIKLKRKKIVSALRNKGIEGLTEGYANLHLLKLFRKKVAFGKKKFPWSMNKKNFLYNKGICPIAEHLQDKSFFMIEVCMFELNNKLIQFIADSFKEVWKELKLD